MKRWYRLSAILLVIACGACSVAKAVVAPGGVRRNAAQQLVDLTSAVVLLDRSAGIVEQKAARMLVEEAAKRSGVTMRVVTSPPPAGKSVISLRTATGAGGPSAPESYTLNVVLNGTVPAVTAVGADPSGCMFAVGYLLREMHFTQGTIQAPVMSVLRAPANLLRGHQLGWRTTSNTYMNSSNWRWNLHDYEQYIRDLIVWGTNSIELIPFDPGTDPVRSEMMTIQLSELIHSYGLQVWMWFPFNDVVPAGYNPYGLSAGSAPDPTTTAGRKFILDRRSRLFREMNYLDGVLLPGGDPGGPATASIPIFMSISADTAAVLHQAHPHAGVWLSNQQFSASDNAAFHSYISTQLPTWLTGVAYGPWAGETCSYARSVLPSRYLLRLYPDIAHETRCQFVNPNIDPAFSVTLDREPPLYRPTESAHVAQLFQSFSCGAICYSEGVNDDLNKVIWSAYLWDPTEDLNTLLNDYGRYFFGEQIAATVVQGIRGIESNMTLPLQTNASVVPTYNLWNQLDQQGSSALQSNWRFQMALLRATFDNYTQQKLVADQQTEASVDTALQPGTAASVTAALNILTNAATVKVAPDLQADILSLGQTLYDSIGIKLSVPLWGALNEERGAIIDHLNRPLANQTWLQSQLTALHSLTDPTAIASGISTILNWENPGVGGFYDDLGNPLRQPHLVQTSSWSQDPDALLGPKCDFLLLNAGSTGRMTWDHYAETLNGTPIVMSYTGLDPLGQYAVAAVYAGRYSPVMTLTANGTYTIHGAVGTSNPPVRQQWTIPAAATAGGTLTLAWNLVSGRGCQVSEVWLIKTGTHSSATKRRPLLSLR